MRMPLNALKSLAITVLSNYINSRMQASLASAPRLPMPSQPSPPNMREIAAALGVSPATVSLALRNDPRVALATRDRVQEYARESKYQVNPAITQFMSHVRTARRAQYRETIGWLNMWDDPENFTRSGVEYLRFLWQGARQRAESLGFKLEGFWLTEPGMTGRRMSEILASRGIRGLLIPPLPQSCGHLSIRWEDFATVALSLTMARPRLHLVVPDHHANMQTILRTLRHRGYRRPGLLLSMGFDERSENRSRSIFYFHQQQFNLRDRIPVHLCRPEGYERDCLPWLKRYRPDAVVTLGPMRHLRELDLGDRDYSSRLGIVLLGHARTDAGFCAMDENPLQIGAAGVDQLAGALNRNERGLPVSPQTTLIRGDWVEGETLPTKLGARSIVAVPKARQRQLSKGGANPGSEANATGPE